MPGARQALGEGDEGLDIASRADGGDCDSHP